MSIQKKLTSSRPGLTLSLGAALFILPILVPSPGLAETQDFNGLNERILKQTTALDQQESQLGRYHMSLAEPLHTLARIQLQANRFDDARGNADRALQIIRWSDGLESPLQFEFLQLVIEIEMARNNWDDIDEKIKHYTWLLSNKYQGDSISRLRHMQWLVDVHAGGAARDEKERRAYHLIQSTGINEVAVQYAQVQGLTAEPLYANLLFSLSRAYHRENEGIRQRGSVSYRLRELYPGLHILEDRDVAIAKRYRFGLEKLEMLRDAVSTSPAFDTEAVLLSEFYIAAWNELYGQEEDLKASLLRIDNFHAHSEISKERIMRLFELRAKLPQHRLVLDADYLSNDLVSAGD